MNKWYVLHVPADSFPGSTAACDSCDAEVEENWFISPRGDKIQDFCLCRDCFNEMFEEVEVEHWAANTIITFPEVEK